MFPRAQTACSLMCNIGEASKEMKAGTAPCSTTWDKHWTWTSNPPGTHESPQNWCQSPFFFWKRSRCLTSYQGPWQLNGIGHITMLLLHSSILCSHLLSMPRCSRGDVCKRPCSFKLQSRLIIHRQEGHKAGQQTCIYDLLQGRVTLLRKQLPEGGVKKFTTIKNILF